MTVKDLTPTPEQAAIIEAALVRKDSLLISACPGSAKTTTLEMICYALPVQPILSLAFSKRIAEAMVKRLPGHVTPKTFNSVGHGVWQRTCTKKLTLNTRKNYEILKNEVDRLPRTARSEAYETFSETLKAIARAKIEGYIPLGMYPQARRLISTDAFFTGFDDPLDPGQIRLLNVALTESIRLAYEGSIDFDDQIYMPTLFGGTFPRFPLVLVDEAQDLSGINHAMLERLVTLRLIAVGDPFQSIYGFRGAISHGMSHLRSTFSMIEFPLSTSFRCPSAIVERARWRAPQMTCPEWAIAGHVEELASWSAADIPEGSAIICRNNAPLFALALRLLRNGRGIKLVGSDIGPGLLRTLKKLGPETLSQKEVLHAIDRWEAEALAKTRAKASTHDRSECLRVFALAGERMGEAIAYAEHLFQSEGAIQLLSGHKAKGLEWETVFHLDPWRIPSRYAESGEEQEQELNVRYVIETRAKKELFLVNLEDMQ